jgi:hypothetical protein
MTFARRLLAITAVLVSCSTLGAAACSSVPSGAPGESHDGGTSEGQSDDSRRHEMRDERTDEPGVDTGGEPYLTFLSVSATTPSDASPAIALFPSYSPIIHDYYVRCAEGTNGLTVSMSASLGSTSRLTQPFESPSLPAQTLSISVKENQAIVAAATRGAATTSYWVRCLPHDMPPLAWTPYAEAGAPSPGYYLVGSVFPAPTNPGYAIVLDSHGVPVWYAPAPVGFGAANVENVIDGAISFAPFSRPALEAFEVRKLSPLTITRPAPTGYPSNIHEFQVLANGNYLEISFPLKFGVDLSGLTIGLADGGTQALGPDATIQDCAVVEFTPAGEIVWSWLATDHFDADKDSTYPTIADRNQVAPDGGPLIDTFHCNSVDVDPKSGNLLVSARNMDSIFYLDRSSGKVLWKAGGNPFTKDGATYVTVPDPFFRQHDARLQPDFSASCRGGSGQISLFDDETGTHKRARGVVYDVEVGQGDGGSAAGCDGGGFLDAGIPGTATVVWQHKGSNSTAAAGSFRISADGSRVIGWGLSITPNLTFTEVDPEGHPLVSFGFDDNETWSYRAIKVPLSALDLGVLRSTAGLP